MGRRIQLQVDYPHVLHVMEARLIQEGFTRDTPDRRRLARLMAGPNPATTKNEAKESKCSTH